MAFIIGLQLTVPWLEVPGSYFVFFNISDIASFEHNPRVKVMNLQRIPLARSIMNKILNSSYDFDIALLGSWLLFIFDRFWREKLIFRQKKQPL